MIISWGLGLVGIVVVIVGAYRLREEQRSFTSRMEDAWEQLQSFVASPLTHLVFGVVLILAALFLSM